MSVMRGIGSIQDIDVLTERKTLMTVRIIPAAVLAALLFGSVLVSVGESRPADLAALMGQPADIAPSTYAYRADRTPEQNPPESWILLMQFANLPKNQPVAVSNPALGQVLCGLLWEEVRPVRKVELSWTADQTSRPAPEDLVLAYFDATDATAHTWWNPRSIKKADKPAVSPDGRTFTYAIPVDTWGVVVSVRGPEKASHFACPSLRAIVPDVWKRLGIEIEWGFDLATAKLDHDGDLQVYDGVIADVHPLPGDPATALTGPFSWRSPGHRDGRHGLHLSVLYMGASRCAKSGPIMRNQRRCRGPF